jgi:hypothetical protein
MCILQSAVGDRHGSMDGFTWSRTGQYEWERYDMQHMRQDAKDLRKWYPEPPSHT